MSDRATRDLGDTLAPSRSRPRRHAAVSQPLLRQVPPNSHRILFVTSEMSDFVKAGGLGDVSAALPRALRETEDVRVLIPGYPQVLATAGKQLQIVGRIEAYAGLPATQLGRLIQPDGLPVYVLLHPRLYAGEGSPYANAQGQPWPDIGLRFAALSYAAAQIMQGKSGLDWQAELLHLNDWPGALAAAYLRWSGSRQPSLLTIHNLAYQGYFPLNYARLFGIPEASLSEVSWNGQISCLRAGLVYADQLTTVSRSYARQIVDPAHGCGMHELLAQRATAGRLSGIVNGIDPSWDPRCDPHLNAHFSPLAMDGKAANADQIRVHFRLPKMPGPLFAVVSRLVHQKGVDLICELAPQLLNAGGQLVLIGGGEPAVEQTVRDLERRYPGRVGAHVGFTETLSRRILAGADFLLMPSRFEPCGLSQMYAQRFGCLPIAHATGGLLDTIEDGVTGFLFQGATLDNFRHCLQRAFKVYRRPELLHAMRCAAMLQSHSWEQARQHYLQLYRRALEVRAEL